MKTETSKEQTKKLIDLGLETPPEIENWLLGMLSNEYVTYYDDDSCIHVLQNYSLGDLIIKFNLLSKEHPHIIKYQPNFWALSFNGETETIIEFEYIDLLVSGIEKLMEGSC